MIRLFKIGVLLLLLSSQSHGHLVQQLFMSLEKPGHEWEINATFDAGYALPEFRDDANSPQPAREWLFTLTDKEHQRLKRETESYLRQSIRFTHGNAELPYHISFPDYQSSPPSFPTLLNGGAYFNVLISGTLPTNQANDFLIHVNSDVKPDFVIASGPQDNRQYHVVAPGKEVGLFQTTTSGTTSESNGSGMLSILKMGYTHVIPKGLDHLLFIVALFLLARKWKPLLTQSLVFTLAHSITLGLAASGFFQINQWSGVWLIEPLIALSIAVVAIENLLTKNITRHRLIIVFLFGLIHGLGFAGSLGTALDQGGQNSLLALAVANLGVELAQVTILAAAWIGTFVWWRSDFYQKFRTVCSASIAMIGIIWMIQRLII
jgi:hypothetical protein